MEFLETVKRINEVEGSEKSKLIWDELIIYNEIKDKENNTLTVAEFKHAQLKRIMADLEKAYKNTEYFALEKNDIFTIILDIVCDMPKDFKYITEASLYKYIKKTSNFRAKDKYNEINKLYINNNFTVESVELLDQEQNEELFGQVGVCQKENYFKDIDDLFNKEFNYKENFSKPINFDSSKEVYLSWFKYLWDKDNILNKKLLYPNTVTKNDLFINELKNWREWATNKQKDKLSILIEAIEQGEDIFIYDDKKGFTLNLKRVGEILYPNRKGNANKDIYDFVESMKKRLEKYLANISKSIDLQYKNIA